MRGSQQVNTSANRFGAERLVLVPRLIASTAAVSAPTVATTAVEPATAISVVTVVSVSESPVVAAGRPGSATTPATTEAENEACDHGEHDYGHNNKEHSHPNSPFTGFPRFRLQSTLGCSAVTTRSGMVRPQAFTMPGYRHQVSGIRNCRG